MAGRGGEGLEGEQETARLLMKSPSPTYGVHLPLLHQPTFITCCLLGFLLGLPPSLPTFGALPPWQRHLDLGWRMWTWYPSAAPRDSPLLAAHFHPEAQDHSTDLTCWVNLQGSQVTMERTIQHNVSCECGGVPESLRAAGCVCVGRRPACSSMGLSPGS